MGGKDEIASGAGHPPGELVLERDLGFHATASHTERAGGRRVGGMEARMSPSAW